MSSLCWTCEDCHHVFVDGKALADQRWLKFSKVDLQLHNVCVENKKTKALAESPFSGQDTMQMDRLHACKWIHEAKCRK
jgi:hypothetical protein